MAGLTVVTAATSMPTRLSADNTAGFTDALTIRDVHYPRVILYAG